MKERPILMSGPMVRAILEGRKTQTRRVMKDAPGQGRLSKPCVYGIPGDRLWVRETHAIVSTDPGSVSIARRYRMPEEKTLAQTDGGLDLIYVDAETEAWAEQHRDGERWRPAIFMPRWASRITLEITDVRVQRLQEISGYDSAAEGIPPQGGNSSDGEWRLRMAYKALWNSINAKRGFGWDTNPWVWALTFSLVRP